MYAICTLPFLPRQLPISITKPTTELREKEGIEAIRHVTNSQVHLRYNLLFFNPNGRLALSRFKWTDLPCRLAYFSRFKLADLPCRLVYFFIQKGRLAYIFLNRLVYINEHQSLAQLQQQKIDHKFLTKRVWSHEL